MKGAFPLNPDLVPTVRAAAWRSPQEAQAWVHAASATPEELVQLLDLLTNRGLAADGDKQAMRRAVFHALVLRCPDEALFRPFVRALRIAPNEVRKVLVDLLPKVNAPADYGELCELFRVSDTATRLAAARAVVSVASRPAAQQLMVMLLEPGFPGLREALDAVMRVLGASGLPLLEKLLTRTDTTERLLAIRWLGDPQYMAGAIPGALRVLTPLLRDPHESVAIAAAIAIGQVASEEDFHAILGPLLENKNLKLAGTVLEGLRRFPTERTAEVLEQKLLSGPNVLRFAALSVIENAAAMHKDVDPLLSPVVQALGHPHIAVRNKAAEVLATLSGTHKVEVGRTIVWLLRSGDVTVRRMAAEVLRSVSDPHGELWPKLIAALRDDDWWVRERVMDALIELAGKELSRYLVPWLEDRSDVVRRFALHVLARLKDHETVPALIQTAQSDPDWWARERAIEILADFRDARALPVILDVIAKSPELQLACVRALRALDPAQAAEQLLPLLTSPDVDVRLEVLKAIEDRNDPAHADRVQPLTTDRDPAVQRLALALLSRWRLSRAEDVASTASDDSGQLALEDLLSMMRELDGEDLLLGPDRPVFMKRHSAVIPLTDGALGADRVGAMLTPLLSSGHAVRLEQRKDVDFSYVSSTGQRFRVNVFRQRGGLAAVFRAVRASIPVLEELGLPRVVLSLTHLRNGLVLIGGPTGSGKSTTLAAITDYINRTQSKHVISLEDPIEVVHQPKRSLVNQREVGTHTQAFSRALRSALREDPDVLLVGELRDFETIQLALTAAETGHLVFGTLRTTSADASIDRLINAFPRGQQDQARASLAESLKAVLCQVLVRPRSAGATLVEPHSAGNAPPHRERLLAVEMLLNNEAVANHIRKAKTSLIPGVIATSRESGMQTMDQDLIRLLRDGAADIDDVLAKARNKKEVEAALEEPPPIRIPRSVSRADVRRLVDG